MLLFLPNKTVLLVRLATERGFSFSLIVYQLLFSATTPPASNFNATQVSVKQKKDRWSKYNSRQPGGHSEYGLVRRHPARMVRRASSSGDQTIKLEFAYGELRPYTRWAFRSSFGLLP